MSDTIAADAAPVKEVVADAAPVPAAKAAPDAGKAADGVPAADAGKGKAPDAKAPQTLADGADDPEIKVPQNYPENWRELMAGADKEAAKQLARYQSPEGVWKKVKNLEKALNERSVPKKPGEDATPEDLAEYRKTVGLAESPEKLVEAIKLPDGRTIGEDDKPVVEYFAKALWGKDVTPDQMSTMVQAYYDRQEEIASQRFEADENFQVESRKALKEEWGAEFKRNVNHLGTLFTDAPEGLFDYMMTARGPDGNLLGNNPNLIKFLAAKAFDLNPQATLTPSGAGGGSVADRLAEIRAMQTSTDYEVSRKYWTPEIQAEEQKLIAANLKLQSRSRPA